MTKERNYGLDCLRIICMLMVICNHTLSWGGLIEGALVPGTANYFAGNILYSFCLVAVNCFVLISGYFLCMEQFKLRRWASVWSNAFLYSFIIYLILVLFRLVPFSLKELIKHSMVFTLDRYWFVTSYLLLCIVSPFLNYAIHNMDKRKHGICCAVLLFVFSFLHNLVYISDFADIEGGYTLLWFCVLYVVAAYIRLYVSARSINMKKCIGIYLICCLCVCSERFLAYYITPYIFGDIKLTSLFYSYNSVFIVSASVMLFVFFSTLVVKKKTIRKMISFFAPLSFTVYLIHEHDSFRPILWAFLDPAKYYNDWRMVPYVLLCVILIFVICCMIEWIRKKLFKLLRITVMCDKVCDAVQTYVVEKIEKVSL